MREDLEYGAVYGSVDHVRQNRSSRRLLRRLLLAVGGGAMLVFTCAVALVIYNGDHPSFAALAQSEGTYNPLTGQFSNSQPAVVNPRIASAVHSVTQKKQEASTVSKKSSSSSAAVAAASKRGMKIAKGGQKLSTDRWYNPVTGEINQKAPKRKPRKWGRANYGYAADLPDMNDDDDGGNVNQSGSTAGFKAGAKPVPRKSYSERVAQFWKKLGFGDRYVRNLNYNPRYNPGGAEAQAGGANYHPSSAASSSGSASASSAGSAASAAGGSAAPAASGSAAASAGSAAASAAASAASAASAAPAAPAPAPAAAFAKDVPQLSAGWRQMQLANADEKAAQVASAEAAKLSRQANNMISGAVGGAAIPVAQKPVVAAPYAPQYAQQQQPLPQQQQFAQPLQPQQQQQFAQPQYPVAQLPQQPMYAPAPAPAIYAPAPAPAAGYNNAAYAAPAVASAYNDEQEFAPEYAPAPAQMNPSLVAEPQQQVAYNTVNNVEPAQQAAAEYAPQYQQRA